MKIILACMALGTALAGCAIKPTQINGPDGRPAFTMKCSGLGRERGDCIAKAGEICPTGYIVVDDNSVIRGGGDVIATRDYLTISCK